MPRRMNREHETSPPAARGRSWRESRHAPLVTHGSLALLTAALITLLLRAPLAWTAVPCVVLHHRVTILLHEYIHGIPLRRDRDDLLVLTVFEGVLLSFGFIEGVRAGLLAHHRWCAVRREMASSRESASIEVQVPFSPPVDLLVAPSSGRETVWVNFNIFDRREARAHVDRVSEIVLDHDARPH